MLYRDFIARVLAPGWLQTPKNAAWLRASGDLKDSLVDRCKAAVKARFAKLAPRDGLDQLGAERQIERGPADTNASFAARVADAWNLWVWAGTAKGVLLAVRDAGYPNALVEIVNGNQYSLDANGEVTVQKLPPGSWAVDALPTFWSKFIVLIPTSPWGGRTLMPTDPRIVQLQRLIRRWKSAHSTCGGLVVINNFAGRTWGYPQWCWGQQRLRWGGNQVSHYPVD
jgi:hypothetical protein